MCVFNVSRMSTCFYGNCQEQTGKHSTKDCPKCGNPFCAAHLLHHKHVVDSMPGSWDKQYACFYEDCQEMNGQCTFSRRTRKCTKCNGHFCFSHVHHDHQMIYQSSSSMARTCAKKGCRQDALQGWMYCRGHWVGKTTYVTNNN